jgi:hypothetical protein
MTDASLAPRRSRSPRLAVPLLDATQLNAAVLPLMGILLFFFCTLIRPARLGEEYSLPGTFLIAALSVLYTLYFQRTAISISRLMLAAAISFYWLYLSVYSMAAGNANGSPVKSLILISVTAFASTVLTSNASINNAFLKSVIYASAALSFSSIVTMMLLYAGISFDQLHIFDIQISGSNSEFYSQFGQVLFPFTICYDRVGIWSVDIPRIAHWFREVGITQAFFAWAALAAFFSNIRYRKCVSFLILLGTLLTLSTVAPFSVAFCLIAMVLASGSGHPGKKLLLFLAIAAVVGLGLYFLFLTVSDSYLGLGQKLASASFSDRQRGVLDGIAFLMTHPFGAGFYNGSSAINLVAALSELGLPGALGFFGVVSYAIFALPRPFARAAMLTPILITMLVSEPLLDAGYFYLLLFCTLPTPLHRTDRQIDPGYERVQQGSRNNRAEQTPAAQQ